MSFKYFIIYSDSADAVSALTDEQAGALFKALFEYVNSGELPEMDNTLYALFLMFKSHIDRDAEQYKKTCEARREAGRAGGLAKAGKAKQSLANLANNNNNNNNKSKNKNNSNSSSPHSFPQAESISELRRQFRAQVSEYEASI